MYEKYGTYFNLITVSWDRCLKVGILGFDGFEGLYVNEFIIVFMSCTSHLI